MTKIGLPQRGLYAITGSFLSPNSLIQDVEQVIQGGAVMIQYRDKAGLPAVQLEIARQLLTICNSHAIPLIINDNIELAKLVGAQGVHIGKDDGNLAAAKAHLTPNSIIGVTCYNDLSNALKAEKQGASYVAFGRFYPSKSKPNAPIAELEILTRAKKAASIPITAIGGISAENGSELIERGADLLAVIDTVFAASSPQLAAQKMARLFK
jgi:thiamine-phosphate pyrophosphorylase